MNPKSLLGGTIIGLLCAVVLSTTPVSAQQYTYVPANGTEKYTGYYYLYDGAQYIYNYGYYFWYDYLTPNYAEWIVPFDDLKRAGLCSGPIDAMSLRFAFNDRQQQARVRIFMNKVAANQYTLRYPSPNGTGSGYPNYYLYAVRGMGSNVQPSTNGVEVHDDANFTLPIMPRGDTTWLDFVFNKGTYVWDGTSSLVIGFLRCSPTYQYIYNVGMLWTTTIPPAGSGYQGTGYFPCQGAYYYNNYYSCTQGAYYFVQYYLFTYNYQNYTYAYKEIRPEVRIRLSAGISQSFPDDVDPRRVLKAGDVYNGSDAAHPKPSLTFYQQTGATYQLTYRIVGPLPYTNVLYTATSGGNSTISHTATATGYSTYTFSEANGTLAGTAGALDLTNANGGSYRVEATQTSSCGTQTWNKAFIISFPNDVAMAEIRSPQASPKKNPLNVTLPLSCQIQNVGLNNVTSVGLNVVIRTYPGGQQVYTGTANWTGNLTTGERASIDFTGSPFVPTAVGKYTAQFCATLKNAVDQQDGNNCLPQAGQVHIFEVNYNQEGSAHAINVPTTTNNYYANRPFQPSGTIRNNGILDGSNWPMKMEIFRQPGGQKVYSEVVVLQSIDAAAPTNFATALFPLFTPDQAGTYRACLTLQSNDPDPSNDQICQDFTVLGNLSGTYTIGLKNAGQSRNYPTIDAAVNDMYLKGVSGAVTFELTDEAYTLTGSINTNGVALDLTGFVSGMSSDNTVTFKPTLERSLTRGSITITLNSLNGVGVLFGQNLTPTNPQAIAREFPTVRAYSNSAGHFIFDGGSQRSIRVNLNASTPFRAPFYLGDGTQSIQLRNLIIGNASTATPSYSHSLPRVYFTNGQFTYENDVRTISGVTYTYSGGIVSRNKMPVGVSGNNSERLDSIPGKNNQFVNNEISGFGYGVVSLGIGTLLKGGVNEFRSYYSTNTRINNNLIYDAGRAGIVAGYEKDLQVMGNRIYNVGQISTGAQKSGGATQAVAYADDAAGIIIGGNTQYNTINATVSANEISGVRGNIMSRGIVVDQVRNGYQNVSSGGGMYYAPAEAEHSMVTSNTVWGLSRAATTSNMGGIHMLTGRNGASMTTPLALDYFTRKDTIANNTVVMTNDNVSGSGSVFGIGSQHGNGTVVMNNAIALQGASSTSNSMHAALYYQGTMFRGGKPNTWYLPANAPAALISNRNAFYIPNAGAAQFTEISDQSEVVSAGSMNEFLTMSQWRNWTGQDINSVSGDFVSQMEFQGVAPNQKLRVKITPQAPIGSILNDRGARIDGIKTDIDGETRGAAGLGYDIGADEFDGRLYTSDLEAVDILSPKAYRSTTGQTSEAEYIMTAAPVDVSARIRNSGGLPRTGADIRVRIWVETMASNNDGYAAPAWSAAPVVDQNYTIDLNSGDAIDFAFGIQGFTPQTYQQLPTYTVPAQFSAMALNVTPRYMIEVSTPNDENNGNNVVSKVARFFIKRALTSIIVSGRFTGTVLGAGSTATEVAGRLNSDSLVKALNDLGFINNPAGQMYSYDLMDRTAWEDRAIDYTIYRTMFWSHDQSAFTRTERDDLRNFVDAGTSQQKKNLAIGSQEPARRHTGTTIAADVNFVNKVLRSSNVAPGTPNSPDYDGKKIVGRAIARNAEETVSKTTYAGDAAPMPALVRLYSDATTPGIALASYSYKKGDRQTTDSIAGSATASLNTNRVFIGVDWRHFARAGAFTGGERVLRGIIDFFEKNGGTVVPVELVNFDAKSRSNDVDVFWATASERNADHFTVERSIVDARAGVEDNGTAWQSVATVAAAGNSTDRRDYSIVDRNLANGLYQYRLSMVDRDGSTARTGVVEVLVGGASDVVAIESVMPNPVRTNSTITLNLASAGKAVVTLVGTDGRTVATIFEGEVPAGYTPVDLAAARVTSGTYTVVANVDGFVATAAVTIVK